MRYIERSISKVCRDDLDNFPVLTLTGPRQSGKSTLLQHILSDWRYVNLEQPRMLEFARSDPHGFVRTYSDRVILDEIQRAPQLLSEIQVAVDSDRRPGRFAVTGSHNLLLLDQVSQSLAGRTAVRYLLPFSYAELAQFPERPHCLEEWLLRGGYPPVHESPKGGSQWLDSYIQTYVERDVRAIRNVADLPAFDRFLRLCAGRTAQVLDLSGIGGDLGVTHNTVKSWIGVLEAGFVLFRVEPYFKNFSKRIIKRPKLYFYDTGLLCRLLDVRSVDLIHHPFRGAIFENWCAAEALKGYYNLGLRPGMFFWRDQSIEVDLLLHRSSSQMLAMECKSGATPLEDFIKAPRKLQQIATDVEVVPHVIYGGDHTQRRSSGVFFAWSDYAHMVSELLV